MSQYHVFILPVIKCAVCLHNACNSSSVQYTEICFMRGVSCSVCACVDLLVP